MLNGTVPDTKEYARNVMKMKKPYNYVNTGVMVFDFNKIRNFTTENKLLDFSGTHHFRIQEQDIINVFYEDHIKFLDLRWNFYLETNSWITQCLEYAPTSESTLYEEARKNPYLLHYANVPKPWDEPESLKAEEFWKTAKETPFYEIIISRLMDSKIKKLNFQGLNGPVSIVDLHNKIIELDNRWKNTFPRNTRVWKFVRKIIKKH